MRLFDSHVLKPKSFDAKLERSADAICAQTLELSSSRSSLPSAPLSGVDGLGPLKNLEATPHLPRGVSIEDHDADPLPRYKYRLALERNWNICDCNAVRHATITAPCPPIWAALLDVELCSMIRA